VWNTGEGRYSEYTPPEPMRRPVGGGLVRTATMARTGRPPSADRYVHMLVNEVVPWVEAGYGPPPDRAQRFVLGSSMGGLVSLYAAEAVPSWFGGAGCLSTHFVLGGDPMVDWYAEHLPGPGAVRLWFDRGTEELDSEYRPFQDRMDAALRASDLREGLDWVSRVYPGTGHNEAAWAARAHEVLRFLITGQAPA
jgi:predicted alpha/beta superfamily hydrolase